MVLPQAMAWVQYWFRVLSLKFCGKSKKKLRWYITGITRFLHVCVRVALKRVKPQPIWMDAKQIIECLLWRKNESSYRIWGWLSHARAGREGEKLGFYHLSHVVIWIRARAFCVRLAWMSRVKIRNSSSLARDSPMQCRLPGLEEDRTHLDRDQITSILK